MLRALIFFLSLYLGSSLCASSAAVVSRSQLGVVAAAFPEAAAGAEMLERGGNAVDAAVAAAFALAVCEPWGSGLGGQTFILIHTAGGRDIAIDGSAPAPLRINLEELRGEARRAGHKSATVPSTVRALDYALRKYGTKTLAEALAPATRIARRGYRITKLQYELASEKYEDFLKYESTRRTFLKEGKHLYRPGELFVQTDLARTLEMLAEEGADAFYRGAIARRIEEDMIENGSYIRRDDLERVRVVEREPARSSYRGYQVVSFPHPGSGETVIEMLNILERFDPRTLARRDANAVHLLAEAMRIAFYDARHNQPHPDTPRAERDARFTDKSFAAGRAALIKFERPLDLEKALRSQEAQGQTTHLSVMDSRGNAVALTQSINGYYGSRAIARGLGFFYNNYISSFNFSEPDHPYYIRPGGVLHSSKSPTILLKDGLPFLAVGSPASPRIITAIVQTIVNVIDGQMSLEKAVAAPRLHAQSGLVEMEPGFGRDVAAELRRRGFKLRLYKKLDMYFGGVHAVLYDASRREFIGAADPRRDGSAAP